MIKTLIFFLLLSLVSCSSTPDSQQKTLYRAIGGQEKIDAIVDNFIEEIGYNETIFNYFKDSDIDRFREKMTEHLCITLDGPCQYTGDTMAEVHRGMNINEADFNLTVDLLINAINKAGISHRQQNKILARLAPMRKEMLYK